MPANAVLGKFTTQPVTDQSFESGIIDPRRIHNVYTSSTKLATVQTLGPRGERNIINTCPVTADYGFTSIDNGVVSHDWIDVPRQLLTTLDFQLRDDYITTIDLRGMPISFSQIFMLQDD